MMYSVQKQMFEWTTLLFQCAVFGWCYNYLYSLTWTSAMYLYSPELVVSR